jgi:hypothetical protein
MGNLPAVTSSNLFHLVIFLNRPDSKFASQELAKALLAEIPAQLLGFMKSKSFTPKGGSSNLV